MTRRDFSGGSFTPINVPGATNTEAESINAAARSWARSPMPRGSSMASLTPGAASPPIDVPGATLTEVFGINDSGQIVGRFTDATGAEHGYLAAPVPEPSTLLLLGSGLAGLASLTWRRARHTGSR